MSIHELRGSAEQHALSCTETSASGLSGYALDLLKDAGHVLGDKAKEAVGGALLYLMASELTLVQRGATLPKEAQALLDGIGCTGISIDGNKVTMSLKDKMYKTFDGCPQMWFDRKVTADVSSNDNRIELKNISGLMVKPGDYVPWAYVKSATLEKRDGSCIAKVTGGRLGVNHTETITLPAETFDQLKATLKANGL